MKGRKIEIRQATADDLPLFTRLFCERDGVARNPERVAGYLEDLDPQRCLAWIAMDGGVPAGMSMVYLRTLRLGARKWRAGYWGNLYVAPDYRRAMVYPRLPLEMFRGADQSGLDVVLTGTRRHESGALHAHLGCREVGQVAVRLKPLRPARLVAVVKGNRLLAGLPGHSLDAAFGVALHIHGLAGSLRGDVENLDWAGPWTEQAASIRARLSAARLARDTGPGEFRHRFRGTLEGQDYAALGVWERGRLLAYVVYRLADRGGLQVGVIMDLGAEPGHEAALGRALWEMERRARVAGAAAMLHLDGIPAPIGELLRWRGYVRSPEFYRMLVWPKHSKPGSEALNDVGGWWLSFMDHDAF